MKKTALSVLAATAVVGTAAVAAPMNPDAIRSAEQSNVDQVRLVCDEYGRCYQLRGPRYIQRSYGDDDDGPGRKVGWRGRGCPPGLWKQGRC